MTRRTVWALAAAGGAVLAVAVAACDGGLNLGGNAYSCDFSLPQEQRDQQCYTDPSGAGSWVCGVDNVCRPFKRDEIFFGEYDPKKDVAPLPVIDSSRAGRLYPLLPTSEVTLVMPQLDLDAQPTVFNVRYGNERTLHRIDFGTSRDGGPATPPTLDAGWQLPAQIEPSQAFSYQLPSGPVRFWLDRADGRVWIEAEPGALGLGALNAPVEGLSKATEIRGFFPVPVGPSSPKGPGVEQGALVVAAPKGEVLPDRTAGEVVVRPSNGMLKPLFEPFQLPPLEDGGTPAIRDARTTLVLKRPTPVVLSDDGLYVRCTSRAFPNMPDAGLFAGCAGGGGPDETWLALHPEDLDGRGRMLAVSGDRTLWAAVVERGPQSLLYVWRVNTTPDALELTSEFTACEPCRHGRPTMLTASTRQGTHVDVGCAFGADGGSQKSVVRVVGTDSSGACALEAIPPLTDPTEVSFVETPSNAVVVAGGAHGQLWSGDSLGDARPRFLDRAPMDVSRLGDRLMALTDQYVALETPGFGMVPLDQPAEERPSAAVENGEGLFILPTGDVVKITPGSVDQPVTSLAYGPKLLGPSGAGAEGPFLGYRVPAQGAADGGATPSQFLASANDSLYFQSDFVDPAPTDLTPDPDRQLVSVLTPEPNFPIRSLAVNDSPEGDLTAQGYVVTSRNLFDFRLDASHQWKLLQIQLPAGEPAEVAMQTPERVYGRVMYRDGTVFTLPSGLALAPALASDGGTVRVHDFEHVYGRPFAVTQDGVFVAEPQQDKLPEGSSLRYIPWAWRPVAVKGGSAPFVPGTLHALREDAGVPGFDDESLYLFDDRGCVTRLLDIPVPKPKAR